MRCRGGIKSYSFTAIFLYSSFKSGDAHVGLSCDGTCHCGGFHGHFNGESKTASWAEQLSEDRIRFRPHKFRECL